MLLVLILITIPYTASCWDQTEIEKRAFIMGMAVDRADGEEIEVTFQIALTQSFGQEGGGEDASFWNISKKAYDLTGARRELTKSIDMVPSLDHCQIIVFSEEYAREGLE